MTNLIEFLRYPQGREAAIALICIVLFIILDRLMDAFYLFLYDLIG